MAGSNTTGQPNTADYNLGRGAIYFAENDATTGLAKDYRHLGNAPEFSISVEVETLEHQSSLTGLKQTDKEVIISQAIGLSMSLDELNFENVALFMSGTSGTYTNVKTLTAVTSNVTAAAVQGRWYDLVDTNGNRLYDISIAGDVTISDDSVPTTTYTITTDYLLDLKMGRVFIVVGGAITGTVTAAVVDSGADTSTSLSQVTSLDKTTIAGSVKFISENPVDGDHPTEYQFHQVSLKAEGDFSLVGDDFTVMQLTGKAEKNSGTSAAVKDKTLTITTDSTW